MAIWAAPLLPSRAQPSVLGAAEVVRVSPVPLQAWEVSVQAAEVAAAVQRPPASLAPVPEAASVWVPACCYLPLRLDAEEQAGAEASTSYR